MYRLALCENNPEDQYRITRLLNNYFTSTGKKYVLSAYSSAEELLAVFQPHKFDVVFFDVELDKIDGIGAAIELRKQDHSLVIVFTTAFPRYVFSSFAAEPLNYLLKPVGAAEVNATVEDTLKKVDALDSAAFAFSSSGVNYRVPVKDIYYFESDRRVIMLHTANQLYRFYGKLQELREMNLFSSFLTSHNSFLVNPEYVVTVKNSSLTLSNGETLPVSSSHAKALQSRYMDFITQLL